MESDLGKLFIGGISWDTDEEKLREYFAQFGEVVEAIIMKDRSTGRARGFGFVVFSDPAVADRVVIEKHTIDGRMVEAKKAVPREDRTVPSREGSVSIQGSPGTGRTKKIFVGGLPSSLTESEFKGYFDQFGTITDVVVMYDHNTQRPRGFGFITYDSEDAVDNVLLRTFHQLNGKMVEVKRAVPKEQSPGANVRPSVGGYNYGLNSPNSILNGYNQGYGPGLIGRYGMGIDSRLGPLVGGRTGLPSFGPSGFGLGINLDPSLSPNFGGNPSLNYNLSYGQSLNPYYSANSSRYSSTIGYGGGTGNNSSLFSTMARNMLRNGGNNSLNYGSNLPGSDTYLDSGTSRFGNNGLNWGSTISSPAVGNSLGYVGRNLGHGDSESNVGLGGRNLGRSSGSGRPNISLVTSSSDGLEGPYANMYDRNSLFGDPTWLSSSTELENAGPFSYELGDASSDIPRRSSAGYLGGYNIANNESNRDR